MTCRFCYIFPPSEETALGGKRFRYSDELECDAPLGSQVFASFWEASNFYDFMRFVSALEQSADAPGTHLGTRFNSAESLSDIPPCDELWVTPFPDGKTPGVTAILKNHNKSEEN